MSFTQQAHPSLHVQPPLPVVNIEVHRNVRNQELKLCVRRCVLVSPAQYQRVVWYCLPANQLSVNFVNVVVHSVLVCMSLLLKFHYKPPDGI